MPNVVVPETSWGPRSFGLADDRTAQVQIKYATQQLRYKVWGMSPSSTPDDTGDYGGFGVEGLAFPYYGTGAHGQQPERGAVTVPRLRHRERGHPARVVHRPGRRAAAGLRQHPGAARATTRGLYGPVGFFDAVDPITGAVGHRYLVLDQSMIMARAGQRAEQPRHPARLRAATRWPGPRIRTCRWRPMSLVDDSARSSRRNHMRNPDRSQAARADWDGRIGRRGVPGPGPAAVELAAAGPAARGGRPGARHAGLGSGARRGRVPGATGRRPAGPIEPLDHGGGDVLAVPAGPTPTPRASPGRVRRYAVAAVADGQSAGPLSAPVAAAPRSARRRRRR